MFIIFTSMELNLNYSLLSFSEEQIFQTSLSFLQMFESFNLQCFFPQLVFFYLAQKPHVVESGNFLIPMDIFYLVQQLMYLEQ